MSSEPENMRKSLDLEAEFLDRLGRHDEAEEARARVPKSEPYTPTTDEVRSGASRYIGAADFDRWLRAHDAEVIATERERAARIADRGYRYGETCDDIARDIRRGEGE